MEVLAKQQAFLFIGIKMEITMVFIINQKMIA
jgi:hypothetical protein